MNVKEMSVGCCENEVGNFFHEYNEKKCTCGMVFCFTCCKDTNVDQGGKHEVDFMLCPACGKDHYAE